MKKYDAIITGGGPIGGYIASKISQKKYDVAVFEKNKEIGQNFNCAGLVTPRTFEEFNIPKKDIVQNKIKGAHIHSPSDKILKIGGDKIHAFVINRRNFDKYMMKQAEKNNADVFLGNKVLSIQKKQDFFEIKTSKKTDSKSSILIGADGPYSKVRDRLFLYKPKEFLRGIGAEIKNTNLNPEYVEIFVGGNLAPGFFAWAIPTNKDGTNARIGLAIKQSSNHSPKYYFKKLIQNKKVKPYINKLEITEKLGGVIPLGVLKKTYDDNVMIVGDAAAQVKPTSGGGIYPGLICAKNCIDVSLNALQKNDFSSVFLKKYQKGWQKDIGFELKVGMKIRNIYKKLSDEKLDKYFGKFKKEDIVEIINKHGDIDYPSKLVKPLLKKIPFLIKFLPDVIKK